MKMNKKRIIIIIAVVAALFIIGSNSNDNKPENVSAEQVERDRQMDLYHACAGSVQTLLKSPKSFNADATTAKYNIDNEQQVIAFNFQATNSFGAEVTDRGVCVFDDNDEMTDYAIA